MLRKVFFNQQLIRKLATPSQCFVPKFNSNQIACFSMIHSHSDEFILPPEERPNYYNVYDDDEIFDEEAERESHEETQIRHHKEEQSEVFNSTFDDEVF